MSLATVRTELAAAVRSAAPELNVYSYDRFQPELPAAVVAWSAPISFQGGTADGALRYDMAVRVIVGNGDPMLSSQQLDDIIAVKLPAAISAFETVAWKTANPTFISPVVPLGDSALAVELTVAIHAPIN